LLRHFAPSLGSQEKRDFLNNVVWVKVKSKLGEVEMIEDQEELAAMDITDETVGIIGGDDSAKMYELWSPEDNGGGCPNLFHILSNPQLFDEEPFLEDLMEYLGGVEVRRKGILQLGNSEQ
jgi:hypothetical protein